MFGLTCSLKQGSNVLEKTALVMSLPLTLPSEGLEVRVSVGLDVAEASALARHVLGTDDCDLTVVKDLLRETSNVAAGVFKRTAAAEGCVFTTGLPTVARNDQTRPDPSYTLEWFIEADDGIRLPIRMDVKPRVPRRVTAKEISEGMVLTADVKNRQGILMMREGTRIAEVHIARLRALLGDGTLIEVADAA